jgi:hypothetical protein
MKVRTRRLWLKISYDVPKDIPKSEIIRTLKRSIRNGDYRYPRNWRVAIQWRNKENAPMRVGEWTAEMQASKESSPGFDAAVYQYLENQQ